MSQSDAGNPPEPPAAALPPEVAAELRRRAEMGAPAPGSSPSRAASATPELGSFILQTSPPEVQKPAAQPGAAWAKRLGPFGGLLLVLLGKLKWLLIGAKFLLPFLKTGGTMLLSIWVYAHAMGWPFAVGFVLGILVHEMGHVFVAWRKGVPVSAPLFIPGFGALILQKRAAGSTWDEALIGIGGPVGGTLAGLTCLGVYAATGSQLFQALAYTAFFINLFNLLPVFPLDGGWISAAISPRMWIIGVVALIAGYAGGWIRNPFIFLLVLLSLPRLWKGMTTGSATPQGQQPVTPKQRLQMGLAYFGLAALLFWLMAETHVVL